MASPPNGQKSTLDWLTKLWPIIVAVVILASAWGVMQTQATMHEIRICKLEDLAEKRAVSMAEIGVRLAEIQRDIQYIRLELDKK